MPLWQVVRDSSPHRKIPQKPPLLVSRNAPTCACGLTNGTALGHADANTDHVCDNGCGVAQGTHADGDDEDLLCDYGCGATIDSNAPVVNKVVFDFEKANSNYGAYTSASGWVIANGCVQAGGTSDSNPYFKAIGADNTTQAVCLNGKNSAIGKLTSPTLTGGISKLTFNYGIMFSDSKVGVTIKITDANGVSQTTTLSDTTMTKFAVETFTWTLETAVTGSFTIEITNTCPSNSTSNKDRISIWNIQYEG